MCYQDFRLLGLPGSALAAVARALRGEHLRALRATCRRARTVVDVATTQVWVRGLTPDNAAAALAHAAARFPHLEAIEFESGLDAGALEAALAALPVGCWPVATRIGADSNRALAGNESGFYLHHAVLARCSAFAEWFPQLARLCPRLRDVAVNAEGPEALGAALGSLAALQAPLRALDLALDFDAFQPGDVGRAAAALTRLTGLRRLALNLGRSYSDDPPVDAEALLPAALPSLTELTELYLAACDVRLRLAGLPASLASLELDGFTREPLRALAAADQLPSVTRLRFSRRVRVEYCLDSMVEFHAVPLAAAKCPNLRELALEMERLLPVPAAAFPHLKRLELLHCHHPNVGADGLLSLAAAAPQLRVLRCEPSWENALRYAVARHPTLRELHMSGWPAGGQERRSAPPLPQLSCVTLHLPSHDPTDGYEVGFPWSDSDEEEGGAGGSRVSGPPSVPKSHLVWVQFDWLGRYARLARLELAGTARLPLRQTLACLGAAAGSRLRHLAIRNAALPASASEAGPALLPLRLFTSLEHFTLGANAAAAARAAAPLAFDADALLLALLAPLDSLLPLFAALRSLSLTLCGLDGAATDGLGRVRARCRELSAAHPGTSVTFAAA